MKDKQPAINVLTKAQFAQGALTTTIVETNWYSLDEVKALADKLGSGMTVYRKPTMSSYSITPTERVDLHQGCEILYQTIALGKE